MQNQQPWLSGWINRKTSCLYDQSCRYMTWNQFKRNLQNRPLKKFLQRRRQHHALSADTRHCHLYALCFVRCIKILTLLSETRMTIGSLGPTMGFSLTVSARKHSLCLLVKLDPNRKVIQARTTRGDTKFPHLSVRKNMANLAVPKSPTLQTT